MSRDARPDLVRRAVCSATNGLIQWKPECLQLFLKDRGIPEKYRGASDKAFRLLLRKRICEDRAEIKTHEEKDPHWLDAHPTDPWLYSLVIPISEVQEGIYVKMKLLWEDGDDPDDAFVELISVHKGLS
jgi:hypothetical protein